jgi:chorismate mutase
MSAAQTRAGGRDGVDAGAAADADPHLTALRNEIERIDRDLVHLIAKRVRIARRVGEAKRRARLPTLDAAREASVVRRAGALARDAGLDGEDVRYLFWHLIGLSRRAQLEET